MPLFAGVDLAWSRGRESGVCWLDGETGADLRCVRLEAGVWELAELAAAVSGAAVVAIDAPVLFSPARSVDAQVSRVFGKYKVGAHNAGAAVRRGYTAGIDLGAMLAADGMALDPQPLLAGERLGRHAVEVYPHTIHVRWFQLAERIRYKKGRVAERRAGLRAYQGHLRRWLAAEAPGVLEAAAVQRVLAAEAAAVRGKALKRLDDTLDGLTCALAAWRLWAQPGEWERLGDRHGCIAVPRAAGSLWQQWDRSGSGRSAPLAASPVPAPSPTPPP